ncbi:PA14 domain-containing protein [Sedimentisphaera salicampi]|uniref:PA14 domain-containing protein n=1 Tax=Sedimentisphaera salicampi TaxID=1941349 RepID=UPI000B9B3C38|nr:PA14 domain-containing protein [Sedimentisphaera salicampi]OXU15736.1 PA14 domain protein [Sedimentisphaera salicampi]
MRSYLTFLLLSIFLLLSSCSAKVEPSRTDYCKMLGRDIQGKQHGFLAGRHMYYIGGNANTEWQMREHETIGFTHPMFRDGRARGYGIVTDPESGTGHDKWGWNFWTDVRCAYGTVIVDGKRYEYPKPVKMIWRPDRQICKYKIAGVNIEEVKFINLDDVLCSIITASKPIKLEFDGRSFYKKGTVPTFDGDKPGPHQISSTAKAEYDRDKGVLHIAEGGTIMTKARWGKPVKEGKIMYDGMHGVIGASVDFANSCKIRKDEKGVCHYNLKLECNGKTAVVLTYALGDDYDETVKNTKSLLKDAKGGLAAKTEFINDLLNEQVPYFRCSNEDVVKTYYYLWSLYFMYFTDTPKGWETYPHTQTAVNNFMGLHLWDSWAYAAMGKHIADKWEWSYGNILSWKHMVPYKNHQNALPDNFGIGWYSPGVFMNFVGVTEFAWQQYEQSGDKKFLQEAYDDLFKKLYWSGPQDVAGIELNAAITLRRMAEELGRDKDAKHWINWLEGRVQKYQAKQRKIANDENFFWKDIWLPAALMSYEMPSYAVKKLVDRAVMDTEKGFVGPVALDVRPPTQPENGVFAVSTISTWQVIEGMFRHGCDAEAIYCTLSHLKGMIRDYGYPIAPECWDPDYKPWGSMYYNWDGPMVCLLIQRLAGVSYNLVDGMQTKFTVSDHLPDEWDFIEIGVPVVLDGKKSWTMVKIERKDLKDGRFRKNVSVKNNILDKLIICPWDEDRKVEKAEGINRAKRIGGITNRFYSGAATDKSVEFTLGQRNRKFKTLAYLLPHSCDFANSISVKIDNLIDNTTLRYTTDGSEPSDKSPICTEVLKFDKSVDLRIRAFGHDGTVYKPMQAQYSRVKLSDSVKIKNLSPGLYYEYYEGSWSKLPNFDSLKPVATGVAPDLEVSNYAKRKDNFAMRLKGYVNIPADDVYNIKLRCNDGARLFIDGQKIAELDGTRFEARFRDGKIGLEKGLHSIEIEYFQLKKRFTLQLSYRSVTQNWKKLGEKDFLVESN